MTFCPKDPAEQEETVKELDRPKFGRRARRDGAVEQIVAAPAPRIAARKVFPSDSLHFCGDQQVLTIVSDFGGGWDKDLVAEAYRKSMGPKLETLSGPALYKSWEGFCKSFVRTRGRA